jgi:hypothetical protein
LSWAQKYTVPFDSFSDSAAAQVFLHPSPMHYGQMLSRLL